jgi:hypoxanthine phosphoribosyltransferase
MMKSKHNLETLFSEREIAGRIEELARCISADHPEGNIIMIALMKGAIIFLADLIRQMEVPVRFELVRVSSYGDEQAPVRQPVIEAAVLKAVKGRDVIIVDDIYDTGNSIKAAVEYIGNYKPRSLKTCFLLEKKMKHVVNIKVDYLGFEVPDKFIVGYGLDLAEAYRDLPYIAVLKE